ncbi:N-acetylmuramoyl-L-alanine amidase [Corynebacterium sp.]|uniref:peptidoglycan recognition protein family protein n=1 Tax=Corynebacterium sp. TaxID=1720 RepID=UPI0028B210C9|nr:N-acetylmuramoyl-L-alanine amidase [Corynebacterium sp.]
MALDYYTVQPHKVALLGGNYTPGRDSISGLARHHTAGILNAVQLNDVWDPNDGRQASTTYLIDQYGIISQHVWDGDTAWANANTWANRNLLSMEHSNNEGPPNWSISDESIKGGGRWGAALATFYKWGTPRFNKNIYDHRRFTSTSCPHHLAAPSGKYNNEWFEEATWFYGQLSKKLVDGQGNPIKLNFPPTPKPKEKLFMSLTPAEEREILTGIRIIKNALTAPRPSAVEGSNFKADLPTYVGLIDRKVEELHQEYAGKATKVQEACEAHAKADAEHKVEDEAHSHGEADSDA